MYKFLILALFVSVASGADTWRQGTPDSRYLNCSRLSRRGKLKLFFRCPSPNGDFPVLLAGNTCRDFYICNDGWRCKSHSLSVDSIYTISLILSPFHLPWQPVLQQCQESLWSPCRIGLCLNEKSNATTIMTKNGWNHNTHILELTRNVVKWTINKLILQ